MGKPEIKYAQKDTLPAKIEPRDEMVLISMRIEGDLLDALKAKATETKIGYQTLMKELVRVQLGLEPRVHLSKPFSESMRLEEFQRHVLGRLEKVERAQQDRRPKRKMKKAAG